MVLNCVLTQQILSFMIPVGQELRGGQAGSTQVMEDWTGSEDSFMGLVIRWYRLLKGDFLLSVGAIDSMR